MGCSESKANEVELPRLGMSPHSSWRRREVPEVPEGWRHRRRRGRCESISCGAWQYAWLQLMR